VTGKSFPPTYSEPAQQASENLRQIIPLVNRHKTPVNPVNYAVWYEYVSGTNDQLRHEIDQHLNSNKPITAEITQTLYEKYVLLDMPDRLEHANAGMKLVVDNTLSNINKVESAASTCVADLTDSQTVLDDCSDVDTLKTIVGSILTNTQTLTETSQELKVELEKSSSEIEKLRSELEAVKEVSRTDALTGLINRGTLDKELEKVCSQTKNTGTALLLFDLDHFKSLNDRLGHLIGDKVLQYFSSLLINHAGDNHLAARFGGEEMVMILHDVSHQQAVEIADKIRTELADSELKHKKDDQRIGRVTVSIGVSFFMAGDTPSSFLDRADKALYTAKDNGRNQIQTN